MKEINSIELLPKETRIRFNEKTRKHLFKDKDRLMQTLKLHRNTVNSWIRGEYNPSLEQLTKFGIDVKPLWKHIEMINLEGGKKKFLIPEHLPLDKLSWLLGILDGDGLVEKNHRIGLANQDTKLIKDFIEICQEIFGIKHEVFSIQVQYDKEIYIDISKVLDIDEKQIKFYKMPPESYRHNKPVIRTIVNSRILYSIMENFRNFMEIEVNKDAKKFSMYVKGMMDSDGSFSRNNIYLTQKQNKLNRSKMAIVKKILDSLNISNNGIKGPNNKNMIYIYLNNSKENLIKYNNFIGFNSTHKNEKLSTLLS